MYKKIIITFCCIFWYAGDEAYAAALRFGELYSLPFYKNNWKVGGLVTVASVATVGIGLQAIAIGVSSLSSAMAGAGAGSYMREVGGNETLGSFLLNVLSIGAELNAGKLLSNSTVLTLKSVQAGGMGAMLLNNKSEVKLQIIPSEIMGSETIQNTLELFQEAQEQFADQRISASELEGRVASMAERLIVFLEPSATREDRVAGSVLLYTMGRYPDFIRYVKQTAVRDEQESYLYYLKAVASLLQNDYESAEIFILKAIQAEPEAIEPKMLYLMILNDLGKYDKILNPLWLDVLLERFDKNHYNTPNSLTSAYNLAGDLADGRQDYKTALQYHTKAFDEIGILSARDDKAILCMKIALNHKRLNDPDEAVSYYRKAMMYVVDERLRKQIEEAFNAP